MKPRALPLLPPGSGMGWTPYAWLVYLPTFFIGPVVMTRAGVAQWWLWPLTVAATLLFLVTYFAGFWLRGRQLMIVGAIQTMLGIVFAPINPGSCVFFVYAASCIATLHRSRDALRGLLLITTLGVATAVLTDAPPFFVLVAGVITLVVGGVNYHYAQQSQAQSKLRLAHDEIEQLAAIAERERIARDLHDVLGHTLSLIVLKSELAVKLSSRDPDRAAREMRDVENVARRTLHDVRHAIRGYRTTLPEELDRARTMLKAARIDDTMDPAPQNLPPQVEETLALVIREAVTNVVRHAQASQCAVRVSQRDGRIVLTVSDDGRGLSKSPGLGLRGIRERVEALGGSVRIDGRNGTRLDVSLPVAEVRPHRSATSDASSAALRSAAAQHRAGSTAADASAPACAGTDPVTRLNAIAGRAQP